MSVLASAKRKAAARLSAHSRYRASNRKLVLNRRRVSNRKRMLIRKRVILGPILFEAITFELGLTDGLESTLFRHHLNPHGAALEPLSLLALEWWFGGCTKSCLCVSFSGVLVMISGLGYVGGTRRQPSSWQAVCRSHWLFNRKWHHVCGRQPENTCRACTKYMAGEQRRAGNTMI